MIQSHLNLVGFPTLLPLSRHVVRGPFHRLGPTPLFLHQGRFGLACFLSIPLITLMALTPTFALAQTTNFNSNARQLLPDQPGAIQNRTFRELERQQQEAKPLKPIEAQVEEAPAEETPTAPKSEVTVVLTKITLEDNTLLDPETTQALITPFLNRPLTFNDIQTLCDKLTELYKDQGYVTSRVFVPPQTVKDGQLTLKAAEGLVGTIQIESGHYFKSRSVSPYITLDRGEPFNLQDLKRHLRRFNSNPDRQVQATLKPGQADRETDIVLKITDRFPVHLTPSFDNLGRSLIGTNRLGTRLDVNNLLGFGDTLSSYANFNRRTFGHGEFYEVPISPRGTTLGSSYNYSNLELGSFTGGENLRVTGQAESYRGFIRQEWLNRETLKLTSDLSLDLTELETSFTQRADNVQVGRFQDSLRVLRTGLTLEEYDDQGRLFVRPELSLGLDWLGANTAFGNSQASRTGAGSQFIKLTTTATRVQQLPWLAHSIGVFRLAGQWTPDQLVSAEQFQVGGAFTVRGYKEGSLIADNGLLVSAEIRTPLAIFPKDWQLPFSPTPLNQALQWVNFVDYGATFLNEPASGTNDDQQVLGVGTGLRYQLTRYLVGWLDLGFPLLQSTDNHQTARLHFGLQAPLF